MDRVDPLPPEDLAARADRAAEELVEVVSPDGSVLDVVSRGEMRARNLRHRCTYVAVLAGDPPSDQPIAAIGSSAGRLVIDPATELWVHQRASWKDTCPSYWDIAFGGVCDVGEDWLVAATRELAEEAGISGVPLTDLGPVAYDDLDTRVVGRCFVAWWPGRLICQDGEVVALDRLPLADLRSWLDGRDVCPDSAAVLAPLLGG